MDEFVPIKDFEGRYGVSRSGDVYSYVVSRKINPMKLCGRYNTGYAIYKLTHLDKTLRIQVVETHTCSSIFT